MERIEKDNCSCRVNLNYLDFIGKKDFFKVTCFYLSIFCSESFFFCSQHLKSRIYELF